MVQDGVVREVGGRSRSQMYAGIGLFAALAIALNLTHVQVPAPFLPYLLYEFWEIPIVVCLLIFGLYASLAASAINTVILLLVNPGSLASGPIYNLIAVTVTLLAVVLGHQISSKAGTKISTEVVLATALAMLMRTAVMTVVNYALLPLPPPLGFTDPDSAVILVLPLIAFFNATLALYTVPLGYTGVRAVSRRVHFRLAYPLSRAAPKN
jgi:riboflavin transporter FmnP